MDEQQQNNPSEENKQFENTKNPPPIPPEYESFKSSFHHHYDTDIDEGSGDRFAGTDRTGLKEKMSFGDTELHKGLESQAKDAEDEEYPDAPTH